MSEAQGHTEALHEPELGPCSQVAFQSPRHSCLSAWSCREQRPPTGSRLSCSCSEASLCLRGCPQPLPSPRAPALRARRSPSLSAFSKNSCSHRGASGSLPGRSGYAWAQATTAPRPPRCTLTAPSHFRAPHPMGCEPSCNLSSWGSAVATQLPLPLPTPTQTWRGNPGRRSCLVGSVPAVARGAVWHL